MYRKDKGFTIVELLIVIVVIGILAAIMIVSYNGITTRANETAVKTDLANIAKKLEAYKAVNGLYPANAAQLDAADLKVSQGNYLTNRNNLYYCRSNDGLYFAVGVWAVNNTRYWFIDGVATKTTDNVYGATTCNKLDPHPHPVNVSAFGYHHDDGTGWQAWTQ